LWERESLAGPHHDEHVKQLKLARNETIGVMYVLVVLQIRSLHEHAVLFEPLAACLFPYPSTLSSTTTHIQDYLLVLFLCSGLLSLPIRRRIRSGRS
jgi:hypothetical protein